MAVPPGKTTAKNSGGNDLTPKSLNSTMSCDPATPSIDSLREVGNSAAVDAPSLTNTLLFSEPIAGGEDFTHDGLQVARNLATDPADYLGEAANIDSPSSGLSTPPALQSDCLFLNKIPAELRNEIYELTFTSDDDEVEIDLSNFDPPRSPLLSTKGGVELSKAHPPNDALLCTCRQIQSEATQLYEKASRQYWSETHFVITNYRPNDRNAPPTIQSIKQDLWGEQYLRIRLEDTDCIRHIRIFHRIALGSRHLMWISTYLAESGIWLWECFRGTQVKPLQSRYLVLRAYDWRVFPLGHEWTIWDHKSDAETAVRKWNHKKPFHVELGSKLFWDYNS
ncbi:hypothetical protein CKM354_000608100 [Cercospora kikuchii]|uniref:Uncharacterized protein n=1 Tax=Cercospora kikuchii TaxID=84275 RepID=A0A9P3FG56_9PEZI|nr:uncharacterized protein CKM354_000608100 [Cercospora kikuchii]GIZ42827.1 hypothetical protein CKM354_000608100 [Cercospora kikuchii]